MSQECPLTNEKEKKNFKRRICNATQKWGRPSTVDEASSFCLPKIDNLEKKKDQTHFDGLVLSSINKLFLNFVIKYDNVK